MDGKIYKVFVSSTYDDLREERAVVQKALLQLDCLPVGMELFPAADDETWSFIKSQIDDADYYVVVVAGRYGSVAPDGIGFTEKEYDYALERKKPAIGFVHGRPGSIPVEHSEKSEERRSKLEAFLRKVKQRPVRAFTNPHELALEVTTSFVKLIRERPSEGYVRSNEAVDYKRYAALLEENTTLKEELKEAEQSLNVTPFTGYDKEFQVHIELHRQHEGRDQSAQLEMRHSLGRIFCTVAEGILQDDREIWVLRSAATWLAGKRSDGWEVDGFNPESVNLIRRQLQLYGLIEISRETMSNPDYLSRTTTSETVYVWKLTDYGRRQLRSMINE
jgi:Domain of unknown function (DUF4062)